MDNYTVLTDEQIKEMFGEYVEAKNNEERHSEDACSEVVAYEMHIKDMFPGNIEKQNESYDKMMDVAVAFEQDGFVAGVKWGLDLIRLGCLIPEKE